jgi:SAM-dependent methyltransferase
MTPGSSATSLLWSSIGTAPAITRRTDIDAGEAFKAFESDGWTAQADTYRELTGAITSRLAEALVDAAGIRSGQAVLDVATGPGYVAERAASRGALPVGVDLAEGMLAIARRRHPNLRFVHADAEQLPFDDDSFEAVVGGFVVNHLPRPERALCEAVRVLRTGGRVAYSVWDRPERMRVIGLASDAIVAAGVEHPAPIPSGGPDPYRFADRSKFEALLHGAGLTEVAVDSVEFTHRVGNDEELWRGLLASTVRSAATIRAQPEAARERIHGELRRLLEPYRQPDGAFELPVAARIGSGRLG